MFCSHPHYLFPRRLPLPFSSFKHRKLDRAASTAEVGLKGVVKELDGVKKQNTNFKYRVAKRKGDLKLKSEELWRKDQTLTIVTQGVKD